MTTRTLTALCLAAALLAAGATPAAEVPEGISDGIKVHGHWKIEIYDPDGTLVSSIEFDNSFVGQSLLSTILQRDGTTGLWSVYLAATGAGTQPCLNAGSPSWCVVGEPASSLSFDYLFKNLAVTGPSSQVSLSGSAVAAQAGSVGAVATGLGSCAPTVSPSTCTEMRNPALAGNFALTYLPSPQSVLTGQIIQVTVTISFS